MKEFKNFGTVERQNYIKDFEWNDKTYVNYLIKFEEFEGFVQINRCTEHEQALIGAQIIFNVNEDFNKIIKYRIIGFKETMDERVKKLMHNRKQREKNRKSN